jgi:hypothetical protein
VSLSQWLDVLTAMVAILLLVGAALMVFGLGVWAVRAAFLWRPKDRDRR